VIFDPLTAGFADSVVLANALVGRLSTRSANASEGPVSKEDGSFAGSDGVEIYSKKLHCQSGRPDLNRRPLDPQSPPGRRRA
jgi:hypothetical protein